MKVENEDKNERNASFISLEIVDARDIENIRDDIILLLDIINLKIIFI